MVFDVCDLGVWNFVRYIPGILVGRYSSLEMNPPDLGGRLLAAASRCTSNPGIRRQTSNVHFGSNMMAIHKI